MVVGVVARETKHSPEGARKREDGAELIEPAVLPSARYAPFKMAVEWVAALVLLVFAVPLIVLTAVLVKVTSRGPVFYKQTRVGWRGRHFTMYKIRTMWHNCESHTGPRWATADDPRITPVGNFLRRTHLDELPQLWNVLRCEMSLVGPRPERPEFVVKLERAIPHYRDRLLVRPGVTGLAQVQLGADTDLESVRRKLSHDRYYVRKLGFWLDVRLILCTAFAVVRVPFPFLQKVLGIPNVETIEQASQSWVSPDGSPAVQMLPS